LKADILLLLTDVDQSIYHSWDRVSPQARRGASTKN
jgi:glutamate 5-kinase